MADQWCTSTCIASAFYRNQLICAFHLCLSVYGMCCVTLGTTFDFLFCFVSPSAAAAANRIAVAVIVAVNFFSLIRRTFSFASRHKTSTCNV